jgi:uncharacterized membrane protein YGL010W
MRTANQWLDEYGESHRHPLNKLLHWICVPAILLSGLGLMWSLPVPDEMRAISPWLNWATLAAAAAIVYYLRLSAVLAGGITLGFVALLLGVAWLDTLAWPLWRSCVAIFVIAWIGQFIGHAVEGRRPSFFKDLQFLLIGPLWLVSFLCRRFGLAW